MRDDDVEVAHEVTTAAFAQFEQEDDGAQRPATPPTAAHARIRHLMATDPGGCWVAVDADDRPIGVALALVREGIWGLSLLVVRPDVQSAGAGGALLRAALAHGARRAGRDHPRLGRPARAARLSPGGLHHAPGRRGRRHATGGRGRSRGRAVRLRPRRRDGRRGRPRRAPAPPTAPTSRCSPRAAWSCSRCPAAATSAIATAASRCSPRRTRRRRARSCAPRSPARAARSR